jgi:pyruvate dehydrogenase E1 component alpha subunit
MKKVIAKFQIEYLQILDKHGKADTKLMPKLSNSQIRRFYEGMVLSRMQDTKAIALQRQGRIGTYASLQGQEAQVGAAFAMEKNDWLVPSFRESGAMIIRGFPIENLYAFWGGDERGHDVPASKRIMPVAIPVSSQTLHIAGIAMGLKLQKRKAAALGFFGDGATSKGDFHEALNFAGVFQAPAVFICQNNQYAISVPRTHQTAAQTIAQKAIAYGIEGIQVDGNDIFAMYHAAEKALKKARAGHGPTLIEAFTYRMSDHTTSDAAKRYRTDNEVDKWKELDPILRLRKYMQHNKIWDEKYENTVRTKMKQKVENAVERFESMSNPEIDDLFKYIFDEMPPGLKAQLDELKEISD